MSRSPLTKEQVLEMVPQQRPMRFISEITELDEEHIIGVYTWKPEDCLGYSPDNDIVPPCKIIEMSAQIGNVAWVIHLLSLKISISEIDQLVGFFTQIEQGECKAVVRPGERVICQGSFGEEGYFRSDKIVSLVEVQFDGGPKDGEEIFTGTVSGMWVPKNSQSSK